MLSKCQFPVNLMTSRFTTFLFTSIYSIQYEYWFVNTFDFHNKFFRLIITNNRLQPFRKERILNAPLQQC